MMSISSYRRGLGIGLCYRAGLQSNYTSIGGSLTLATLHKLIVVSTQYKTNYLLRGTYPVS